MKDYFTKYTVIISWSPEDNAFIAMAPQLDNCVVHSNTTAQALKDLNQAIEDWLDAATEYGWEIPKEF